MSMLPMGMLATFRKESPEARKAAASNEASLARTEREDTRLIKNTAFEELAQKIDEEDVQPRNIFKELVAVYFFMRFKMGMRRRPITVEEFEAVLKSQNINPQSVQYVNYDGGYVQFLNDSKRWNSPKTCGHWTCFDPIEKLEDLNNFSYVPPNIQTLVHEIYQKRFGRPIPRPSEPKAQVEIQTPE